MLQVPDEQALFVEVVDLSDEAGQGAGGGANRNDGGAAHRNPTGSRNLEASDSRTEGCCLAGVSVALGFDCSPPRAQGAWGGGERDLYGFGPVKFSLPEAAVSSARRQVLLASVWPRAVCLRPRGTEADAVVRGATIADQALSRRGLFGQALCCLACCLQQDLLVVADVDGDIQEAAVPVGESSDIGSPGHEMRRFRRRRWPVLERGPGAVVEEAAGQGEDVDAGAVAGAGGVQDECGVEAAAAGVVFAAGSPGASAGE